MKYLTGENSTDTAGTDRLIDARMRAHLQIVDAFPLGMLGYMVAESRAKREGKEEEFYAQLDALVDKALPQIDDLDAEPFRPFVQITQRMIDCDAMSADSPRRHRVFTCRGDSGVIYADRFNLVCEDYAAIAFVDKATLELRFFTNCPEELKPLITRDAKRVAAGASPEFWEAR